MNGKMDTILVEDGDAYLCLRTVDGKVIDGQYMVVPKDHVEKLPSWILAKYYLFCRAARLQPDNFYANLTPEGGALLPGHAHLHIIVRKDGLRLGMNGLIERTTSQQCRIRELEEGVGRVRENQQSRHQHA